MINQEIVINHDTAQKESKNGNCKEDHENLKTSPLACAVNCKNEEGYGEEGRKSTMSDENYEGGPRLLKDVERSKKFYLKWIEDLEKKKNEELEDLFLERTAEEEDTEEDEEIIQVVWYEGEEEETDPKKLIQIIEAVEGKKSNSKFTLSLVEEEEALESVDSEGESRGAFLEAKDSFEIIASTWSLNPRRQSLSSLDENEQVSSVWCEEEQMWVNFLHEELGKLTSADQHAVLEILEGGARGRLNIRDVASCLNSLVNKMPPNEGDSDPSSDSLNTLEKPSKRVIFREAAEMSADEMVKVYERLKAISHISQKRVSFSHSPSELSHSQELYKSNKSLETAKSFETTKSKLSLEEKPGKKRVSFLDLVEEENPEDNRSKTIKRVSFHHLISQTDLLESSLAPSEQSSSDMHPGTSVDDNKNDTTSFQVVIIDSNEKQMKVNSDEKTKQPPSTTCSMSSACLNNTVHTPSNSQSTSDQKHAGTEKADQLPRQSRNVSICSHRDANLKAKSAHTFHRCVETDPTIMQNNHMHLEVGKSDEENMMIEQVNADLSNSYSYNGSELEGRTRSTIVGSTSQAAADNVAMLKEIIGEPYEFSKGDYPLSNQKIVNSNNQVPFQGKHATLVDLSHSKPNGQLEGLDSFSGYPDGACSYTMTKSEDTHIEISESRRISTSITTNHDLGAMDELNLTGNNCETTTYYTSVTLMSSNHKSEMNVVEDGVAIETTSFPETDSQTEVDDQANNIGSSTSDQKVEVNNKKDDDFQVVPSENEVILNSQSDVMDENDSIPIIDREISSKIVLETRSSMDSFLEDSLVKQHSQLTESLLSAALFIPESQQLIKEPLSSVTCEINPATEDEMIPTVDKPINSDEVPKENIGYIRETENIINEEQEHNEIAEECQSTIFYEPHRESSNNKAESCHNLEVLKTEQCDSLQKSKPAKPKNPENKLNASNWLKKTSKQEAVKKEVDAIFKETRLLFREIHQECIMRINNELNQSGSIEESKPHCETSKKNLSGESTELLETSLISANSEFETTSELVLEPGPESSDSVMQFQTEDNDESTNQAPTISQGDTIIGTEMKRKKRKKAKSSTSSKPGCTDRELMSGEEYETADSDG